MNNCKHITPPQECTGCALCANVCGYNAISMVWSKAGFLVPQVNTESCINCGACVRACPAQPEHLKTLQQSGSRYAEQTAAAYGGWNVDEESHLASSSGGIFTALAESVFAEGGCVFGVVWANKDTARFSKAENKEVLAAMRGSKYTQAIPGMVYREVRAELKKGRRVLFCGTACQVYALRQYLRKDYENLLLVDILCHGVPSRNLLLGYIREWERQEGKAIERIRFRDKATDWQNYQVTKIFTDGSTLSHCNKEDMFIRLFVGDYVLNQACYACPHASFPRVGDITLGDFWGNLQQTHADWPIRDGIGSVLGNTRKGIDQLSRLREQGKITLIPVQMKELIEGQPSTYHRQHTLPPQHQRNLQQIREKDITVTYKKLVNSVRCGLFRFTRHGMPHRIYTKLLKIWHKQVTW